MISAQDQTIDYPETDGQPMGETDWHIDWTLRLRVLLEYHFRDRRVYVAGDLLLYYHEGVPSHFVVPDGFVVLDCDPHRRPFFKTWEEQRVPNAVFEFTSASTRRNDDVFKPRIYAALGVPEYFLYDPVGDYLSPRLQGHRLTGEQGYVRIQPDNQSRLHCEQLGLTLELADGELVLRDASNGETLLTEAQANAREANAKSIAADAAQQEAMRLETVNSELEAELKRLREELDNRQ